MPSTRTTPFVLPEYTDTNEINDEAFYNQQHTTSNQQLHPPANTFVRNRPTDSAAAAASTATAVENNNTQRIATKK